MHRDLGSKLEQVFREAQSEIFVASPYVKANALQRLLGQIGPEISLHLIARWRPEDLAAGASDLEVFSLLKGYPNSKFQVCRVLHAKYYRNEAQGYQGSANLTNSGLGWSHSPNLELLQPVDIHGEAAAFEVDLKAQAITVDEEMVAILQAYLDSLPPIQYAEMPALTSVGSLEAWLPHFRDPEALFAAYNNETEAISTGQLKSAQLDLAFIAPPAGMPQDAFKHYVKAVLWESNCLVKLRKLLSVPRRFGEVSQWLRAEFKVSEPKHHWQTLMRWLLYFYPDKFKVEVFDYSEVVSLRTP